MARRDRERRPARRQPFREPKPTILIVCEGEITEPQYLKGFKLHCHNPRVDIVLANDHGVPKTLVEYAKREKLAAERRAKGEGDENLSYDSVWVVFDIDDHPMVAEAKQMAAANKIHVAVSNPSFELWLLLHFTTTGMQHRDAIVSKLRTYLPNYVKAVKFSDFAAGYLTAVNRAKQLAAEAEKAGTPHQNPTTSVHLLTELIRGE